MISQSEKFVALLAKNLSTAQEHILLAALEVFQADVCTIFTLNPITGELAEDPQIVGESVLSGREFLQKPRPHGFTRKVLAQGQVLVEDLELQPQWASEFSEREKIRAFAALALGAQPRPNPFAVLYIDYRRAQKFDAGFRERLDSFCEQASPLLQNAWLLKRYHTVQRVGQEINEELGEIRTLFEKLNEHVRSILDTSYFFMLAVYFAQTDRQDIYCSYRGQARPERRRSPVTPACRWVIDHRDPLYIRRYSEEAADLPFGLADFDEQDPAEPESLIFVPLLLRGNPLGVLSIQSLNAEAYDDNDLQVLELLANHVALALNNIRLYEDLDQLSQAGPILPRTFQSLQAGLCRLKG